LDTTTYIIAEAGNNHRGYLSVAKDMIRTAADAGCDAIKFQTYKTDLLTGIDDQEILDHLKRAELDYRRHKQLMEVCEECNIDFISSAFDIDSINLLRSLGLETLKIPSGQITDKKYLNTIMECRSHYDYRIFLSTGMCSLQEIEVALDILGKHLVTLLHCNSAYPTPMGDVNLRAMQTLKALFGLPVGLSDHTPGIEVPIAAVALGAEVIEKHFTLDKTMEGPDQSMSIEPDELKAMVKAIRNVEKALGDGVKRPMPSEQATMKRRQK